MTCFQNESIYIQKTHLLCDACIVYIDIENFKCVFSIMHFLAKILFRYHFLGHFLAEFIEIIE